MRRNDEWDYTPQHRVSPLAEAGMGVVRLALLFGSGAVAIALAITPTADRNMRGQMSAGIFSDGLDRTVTGSVRRVGGRSNADPVCLVRPDGSTRGRC